MCVLFFILLNEFAEEPEIFSTSYLINSGIIDVNKCLLSKRIRDFIDDFSGYVIEGGIPVEKYVDLIMDTIEINNIEMLNGLEKVYGDFCGHGNLLLCKAIYSGNIDTINWLLPRLNSFSIDYEMRMSGEEDNKYIPIMQRMDRHKSGIKAVDLINLVWPDSKEDDAEIIEEIKSKLEKAELFQVINTSKNHKFAKSL